jgi:F0F1-type ATP synthase gamma subunit
VLVGSYNAEMLQRIPQDQQEEIMRQRCSILATAGSKGASFWDVEDLPLTNGLYDF